MIDEVASENMIRRFPDAAIIAELISSSKIKEQNPETVDLQLPVGKRNDKAYNYKVTGRPIE